MNKKQSLYIVLFCVVLVFALNLFFGRFFAARISTIPLLNRFNILSPQAPIVINTREEIRVNDGKDILEAISGIKSRLSQVVNVQGGQLTVSGYAVNVASEGLFVAPAGVFSGKTGDYYVVLSDGRRAPIGARISDPATSVVFFSAALNSVPVPAWGDSKQLKPGEKIIAIKNSLQTSLPEVQVLFLSRSQADVYGQNFDADQPSRSFALQGAEALALGTALVNTQGEVVGVAGDKGAVISSDVLRKAQALFFGNQQKISRPRFGFTYTQLAKAVSQIRAVPEGAQVLAVDRAGKTKSPALEAGLLEKDIIVSVDGQTLGEDSQLEELLQKYKAGDAVKMQIVRGKETKDLTLQVKELEK